VTIVPEDLPPAYGDSRRITQCLMNLAGNALKFTRRVGSRLGSSVWLTCFASGCRTPGSAFRPERIGGIFAEFQQADATISRSSGNRARTQYHQEVRRDAWGAVWVESELGKGSTFFLDPNAPGNRGSV